MVNQPHLSFGERMSREVSLSSERTDILRKSYLLLSIAIVGMMIGGKVGVSTPAILNLFSGWLGWILAMVALNFVPVMALKWQHNPTLGTLALFADGLIAGLVLAPMLYVAQMMSGTQIVTSAAWITGAIFISITAFVYFTGTRWAPSRALWMGIFFSLIGATILNFFMPMGILGILIAAGIGIMGVMALVSATSEVLHSNPDSPVPGALMLFSGVFMVFQAVMYFLMHFMGRDE